MTLKLRIQLIVTLVVVMLCVLAAIRADENHHGRTVRSAAARRAFRKLNPCPATGRIKGACPGYVIDHIKPLACGGADAPFNMQWQTVDDGKAKDAVERKDCGK